MKQWITLLLILMTFSACQSRKHTPQKEFNVSYPTNVSGDEISYADYSRSLWNNTNQLIVIDAGHGGDDIGTSSLTTPKYQEKSLNLTTALLLKDFLQKMGYMVTMTRSNDTFIPLATRSLLANSNEAKLFVSVHYNAALSDQPEGVEVYYYNSDQNKARTHQSKLVAENVLTRVIQKTRAKSRGVKHGNLAVIRETNMPAILVEGGFMTNKGEMERIKDPGYIKQLALGIALGIDDYLRN